MDLAINSKASLFTFTPKFLASIHQNVSSQCALFSSRKLKTIPDFLVNRSASKRSFQAIHVISFISEIELEQAMKEDAFINLSYLSRSRLEIRDCNSKTGMD